MSVVNEGVCWLTFLYTDYFFFLSLCLVQISKAWEKQFTRSSVTDSWLFFSSFYLYFRKTATPCLAWHAHPLMLLNGHTQLCRLRYETIYYCCPRQGHQWGGGSSYVLVVSRVRFTLRINVHMLRFLRIPTSPHCSFAVQQKRPFFSPF